MHNLTIDVYKVERCSVPYCTNTLKFAKTSTKYTDSRGTVLILSIVIGTHKHTRADTHTKSLGLAS